MRSLEPRWWKGKRVLVTGADGFIGQRVVSWLTEWELVPAAHIRRFSLPDGDLRSPSDARWAVAGCDVILHLAADVGGRGYGATHAADQYFNCSAIDLAVVEAARLAAVSRMVIVSCSTAYPASAPSPLVESALFDGLPQASHLGYGLAKRNGISLAGLYAKQHGMSISAIVANDAYGPGDHFDATAQEVASIVRTCCSSAGALDVWEESVAIRDLVYVDDLVMGVLLAAELLTPGSFVNIGSGIETTVATLVDTIVKKTGFGGAVQYRSEPSGDPRRPLDISKAGRELGYVPQVPLDVGLERTIDWYRQQA